eukprot:6096513-Pleurochrysis_carterae.AAC.1
MACIRARQVGTFSKKGMKARRLHPRTRTSEYTEHGQGASSRGRTNASRKTPRWIIRKDSELNAGERGRSGPEAWAWAREQGQGQG